MAKTVLVTGASGFVASHVINEFLDAGWNVRGTVRNIERSNELLSQYPHGSKLEFAQVKDIITGQGLREALKGVDTVAHTASPYFLTVSDPKKDFLDPAIEGTLSVLRAAKEAGIKRVVVTSSFAAVTDFDKGGPWRDYTYTAEDWNPTTFEQALEPGRPGAFVYSASKKLAEQYAIEYGNKEGLEIITINPPMIYGTPLVTPASSKGLNTSTDTLYWLINGKCGRPLHDDRLPLFCSVKDVALAHVRALERPVAKGRYLVYGGAFTWEEAVRYLQVERPALADRLPAVPESPSPKRTIATLDVGPAQTDLGLETFDDWKTVLLQVIDWLVEQEKTPGWAEQA